MIMLQLSLLFCAAVLTGIVNSVAGGGSFFAVPAMIFCGIPPVLANTNGTVVVWPGSAVCIGAYRRELAKIRPALIIWLVGTSLVGGTLGATLLLHTQEKVFIHLLPYFMLVATLLFPFGKLITKSLRIRNMADERLSLHILIGVSVAQFLLAIYAGFFGGGVGIMMLAVLALIGMENILMMNALKVLLSVSYNGIAAIVFIWAHAVMWPTVILMGVGAMIGAYAGAYVARKIDQKWIRYFVSFVAVAMTCYFFVR